MLTSKTSVAPLKELSIQRLELMAALIPVRLVVNVKGALALQQGVKRSKLWLDSQTALFWIMNRGEWKQFIKHLVNEILVLSDKEDWRYCPSQENPADIGAVGLAEWQLWMLLEGKSGKRLTCGCILDSYESIGGRVSEIHTLCYARV